MRNWQKTFEALTEEQKNNLAILRVMECSNGVIQYAYRDQASNALSIEDTRRAMKFSMGCIKKMEIPLGETTITFGDDLKEIFGEIRDLYQSGKTNRKDFDEFMKISIIMYNVLGKERVQEAQKVLSQHITEIAPEHLQWGANYIINFIQ
jgi:hypothetical protein